MTELLQSGNPWLLPMAAVALLIWIVYRMVRGKGGGLEHAIAEISFDRIEGLVIPNADEGEILVDYLLLTSQGLLILEVNRERIKSIADFREKVEDLEPGELVNFYVQGPAVSRFLTLRFGDAN